MNSSPKSKLGKFSVPRTRKTGRKVDTWSYAFPDRESAEISVNLYSEGDALRFVASSNHPRLKGRSWEGTDIMSLSAAVKADIESLTARLEDDRWQDTLLLEVTPDFEARQASRTTSLTFTCRSVALDVATPKKNDGTRDIIEDGKPGKVRERAWSDESHLGEGAARIRLESDTSRSLLPDTPKARGDIARLEAMLTHFSQSLASSLSPARPDPTRIPGPDDLIEMMKAAAEHVAKHPTPSTPKDSQQ